MRRIVSRSGTSARACSTTRGARSSVRCFIICASGRFGVPSSCFTSVSTPRCSSTGVSTPCRCFTCISIPRS